MLDAGEADEGYSHHLQGAHMRKWTLKKPSHTGFVQIFWDRTPEQKNFLKVIYFRFLFEREREDRWREGDVPVHSANSSLCSIVRAGPGPNQELRTELEHQQKTGLEVEQHTQTTVLTHGMQDFQAVTAPLCQMSASRSFNLGL